MKKAEEIAKKRTYSVPTTSHHPVNARVLCWEISGTTIETDAGIILPPAMMAENKKGDQKEIPRFIVVKAAEDACFLDANGKCYYQPQPGDEVYPFWPEDAENFSFPRVYDYARGVYFTSFHISEFSSYIPREVSEE